MVRLMVESGLLPEGSLQLVIGGTGDLLDRLDGADVVTFTGSADTAAKLRANANLIAKSMPFNAEADSLNCAILGPDVTPRRRGVRPVRQGSGARDDDQGRPEVHRDPARDRAAPASRRGRRERCATRLAKVRGRRSVGRGRADGRAGLGGAAARRRRARRDAGAAATRSCSAPRDGFAPLGEGVAERRVLRADAAAVPRCARTTTRCTTSRPSARSAR